MANSAQSAGTHADEDRRDFLMLAAGAAGVFGVGALIWPFIDAMNPAADTLALATTEVDLSPIEVGQRVTVQWRGKPVFVDHRTERAIEAARQVELDELKDPEADDVRVQRPEWLVMVGICTHLGCIPKGQAQGSQRGPWGGWFCPCHGSAYDTSGRIRTGPAPRNLEVPPYEFLDDTRIRIG